MIARFLPVLLGLSLLASLGLLSHSLLPSIAVAAPPPTLPAKASPPAVGEKARDFELEGLDDRKIKLSALAERSPVVVVVLRGFPGYQCPVCSRQVRQFIEREKDLRETGAEVVMIYPGSAEALKKHAGEFTHGKAFPPSFHFVLDPDFQFTEAWGLRWKAPHETAYPSTFVVGKDLVIRLARISKTHGGRAKVDDVLGSLR